MAARSWCRKQDRIAATERECALEERFAYTPCAHVFYNSVWRQYVHRDRPMRRLGWGLRCRLCQPPPPRPLFTHNALVCCPQCGGEEEQKACDCGGSHRKCTRIYWLRSPCGDCVFMDAYERVPW